MNDKIVCYFCKYEFKQSHQFASYIYCDCKKMRAYYGVDNNIYCLTYVHDTKTFLGATFYCTTNDIHIRKRYRTLYILNTKDFSFETVVLKFHLFLNFI